MPANPNKLSRFWQELKRRKVIYFLIGYVAACFAVIEFFTNTSERFNIPDSIIDLLYILAAIGLPVVIILPWFIFRRKIDDSGDDPTLELKPPREKEEKPKHNLPAQLATFIGRQNEMQMVHDFIGQHRLVTLTGAGGCGKTRLACEVAIQLLPEFEDGVWFVDLSPIAIENLVVKEITEALKIAEEPDKPLIDTLIEKIKDQNLLIILDNCEHLITACAETAGKLVKSNPNLQILATSRKALNIKGEKVWRVPSLTLLDPKTVIDTESAKSSEAVLLFTDRAQLNNPEFQLESENVSDVVTICNKLDGIPLALELVASRTRHMNAEMILERFENRFDQLSSSDPGTSKRQQTLQATIEWSYNLLSENEKRLFTRLAVFSGGFDITAAEEVCSDETLPKESVLDMLSQLIDQSLVYNVKAADHGLRYKRLETLRQFAMQKLQLEKEEDSIRSQHLLFYLKLAEQAYEEQFESQLKWLNKLEEEHDNLITALNWSYKQSSEYFYMLSGYLGWFWLNHSHIRLGMEFLKKVLSEDTIDSQAYARNLYSLGSLMWYTAESPKAVNYLTESLQIWRQHKNLFEEAIVLQKLTTATHASGDFEASLKYGNQGLEIARKLGKPGLFNASLQSVCASLTWSKEYEKVKPLLKELLISSQELEQSSGIATAHHFIADSAQGTGNYIEAEKEYCQVISLAIKFGMPHQVGIDMQGVAFALAGQSRWAKSIRLDTAAREIAKQYGFVLEGIAEFWDEWIETYLQGARREVGEELSRKYEEEGTAMGFEKAVEYALDFKKD